MNVKPEAKSRRAEETLGLDGVPSMRVQEQNTLTGGTKALQLDEQPEENRYSHRDRQ